MKGLFIKGNHAAARLAAASNDDLRHLTHGMGSAKRLKRDVELHGSRSRSLARLMNGDQSWSKALRRWREEIIGSLGGKAVFTTEAWELLSRIVMGKVILDSIDSYILTHPVINKKRHRVWPIIMDRDRMVTAQMLQFRVLREITCRAQQQKDITPMSEKLRALAHGDETD